MNFSINNEITLNRVAKVRYFGWFLTKLNITSAVKFDDCNGSKKTAYLNTNSLLKAVINVNQSEQLSKKEISKKIKVFKNQTDLNLARLDESIMEVIFEKLGKKAPVEEHLEKNSSNEKSLTPSASPKRSPENQDPSTPPSALIEPSAPPQDLKKEDQEKPVSSSESAPLPRRTFPKETTGLLLSNGNRYNGFVLNDKPSGKGSEINAEGQTVYSGQWENGLYEGEGILLASDGGHFNGHFKEGNPHGKIKRTYLQHSSYKYFDGHFEKGKMSQGQLWFNDDSSYVGSFQDEKITGFGTFFFKSGNKLTGAFLDGRLLYGKFEQVKGSLYIGGYDEQGKKHGKVVFSHKGEHFDLEYDHGKMVKSTVRDENAPLPDWEMGAKCTLPFVSVLKANKANS